uniref:Uncharacterized protein n=1 Tax=Arcella intermedia TaxID=1963864 RepID=A0A6B2LRR1_9EUKA
MNLEGNKIGDAGARLISESLKSNSTLTSLNLERNQIGFAGAQSIFESLKDNSSLKFLYLMRIIFTILNPSSFIR